MKSIAVGGDGGCAIREADDRIACWGTTSAGPIEKNPGTDPVLQVAIGTTDVCAIRTLDHRVACWGKLQNVPSLSDATYREIAFDGATLFGVREADDRLVAIGKSSEVTAGLDRIKTIRTNTDVFAALRFDGHPSFSWW